MIVISFKSKKITLVLFSRNLVGWNKSKKKDDGYVLFQEFIGEKEIWKKDVVLSFLETQWSEINLWKKKKRITVVFAFVQTPLSDI